MGICSCFYHSYLFVCNEPIKPIVLESVVLLNGVIECLIFPEFLLWQRVLLWRKVNYFPLKAKRKGHISEVKELTLLTELKEFRSHLPLSTTSMFRFLDHWKAIVNHPGSFWTQRNVECWTCYPRTSSNQRYSTHSPWAVWRPGGTHFVETSLMINVCMLWKSTRQGLDSPWIECIAQDYYFFLQCTPEKPRLLFINYSETSAYGKVVSNPWK